MDKRSIAIGILIGIAIVGCLAAIEGPEKTDEGRYQVIDSISSSYLSFLILDTEDGTVNHHTSAGTTVFPFYHDQP